MGRRDCYPSARRSIGAFPFLSKCKNSKHHKPFAVFSLCHVEAEQDLSRLKKKNGMLGTWTILSCV